MNKASYIQATTSHILCKTPEDVTNKICKIMKGKLWCVLHFLNHYFTSCIVGQANRWLWIWKKKILARTSFLHAFLKKCFSLLPWKNVCVAAQLESKGWLVIWVECTFTGSQTVLIMQKRKRAQWEILSHEVWVCVCVCVLACVCICVCLCLSLCVCWWRCLTG